MIESLDRLTRQKISDASDIVRKILKSGVDIATTTPERLYTAKSLDDPMSLIEMMFLQLRANEESQMKSDRISDAWRKLRETARSKVISSQCPSWLRLSEDRKTWQIIEEKANIVRYIFQLALDGLGVGAIMRRLNKEAIPTLRPLKSSHKQQKQVLWTNGTLRYLLRSKTVIGELQLRQGHKKNAKPAGESIPNYYTPIIDLATFYRVQEALDGRRQQKGRTGTGVANLFTGILYNAADKSRLTVVAKTGKKEKKMVSSGAMRGLPGSEYVSYSYSHFERAFLRFVVELKPDDLLPPQVNCGETDKKMAAAGKELQRITERLAILKKALKHDDTPPEAVIDAMRELEIEAKKVSKQIGTLNREKYRDSNTTELSDVKSIASQLAEATGDKLTQLRYRLRSRIKQLISEIWVYIYRIGENKHNGYRTALADCQVFFRSGLIRTFCCVGNTAKIALSGYSVDSSGY